MRKFVMAGVFFFFFLFLVYSSVFSQQGSKSKEEELANFNVTRVVKTVDGLNFVVAEDRPIQKVGGIYRPVSLDAYVTYKVNKLEKKMNETTAELEKKIQNLSTQVDVLNQKVETLSKDRPMAAKNETVSSKI